MYPKDHIIAGAFFSAIFYLIFPQTEIYNLVLIFLASFLIDFDHYLASIFENRKNINLFRSLKYHEEKGKIQKAEREKGIREKGTFHLFHTIEFHIIVLLAGLFISKPFLYVFIGMVFHSMSDIIWLIKLDYLYRREFFLTNWILNRSKNKNIKKK